jgi:threonine aldolase
MAVDYQFGSDNHSGVHPDIMMAIQSANTGNSVAYGDDPYTDSAIKKFRDHFGNDVEVFFVGNGTAANILGIKSVTDSFNSIFCAETAHLNVHECCGPEKFTGCKLVTIPTNDGKLSVDLLEPYILGFDDPHMAQPKVISITQSSELGTVYKPWEIKTLSDFAHGKGIFLHMDGARLCNAAASLDSNLKQMTTDVGVDLLSFGGTKNGMMFGDAVVFFDKRLSKNFQYIRKQGMHLTSKMRFISAQFYALLSDDLWLGNAKHANGMARLLSDEIKNVDHIRITQKVQANAVFATISKKLMEKLREKYFFHIFNERNLEVRWMCSFNTTREDVLDFAGSIKKFSSQI